MTRRLMIAAACLLAAACRQQPDDGAAAGNDADGRPARAETPEPARAPVSEGLASAAEHGKFVNALRAAGLEETLSGAQPYTVFAPTDEAFGRPGSGAPDDLLAPENKARLVAFLTDHIVPGLVTAQDLARAVERGKGKASLATVGGATLTIARSDSGLTVAGAGGGSARIVGSERLQSNGAIHSVDSVLASGSR